MIRSVIACVFVYGFGQGKNLDIKATGRFFPGKIILTSGEVIDCDLQYHFQSGILHQKYQEKRTRPFTANNVVSFEFLYKDDSLRQFYSLPYTSNGGTQYYFFEILFEKKEVAVLSSYYVAYLGEDISKYTYVGPTITRKELEITEIIYIVDGSKGLTEFLELTKLGVILGKKKKIGQENQSHYKLIDKSRAKEFFGIHYDPVMEFVELNKIKLNRLNDLIRIMNFYADLK